jgi:hypothetical protein
VLRGGGGGGVPVREAGELCWTSLVLGIGEIGAEVARIELATARWRGRRTVVGQRKTCTRRLWSEVRHEEAEPIWREVWEKRGSPESPTVGEDRGVEGSSRWKKNGGKEGNSVLIDDDWVGLDEEAAYWHGWHRVAT